MRIECKRYRDDTSLNDRLLLGEIDQAIVADPALEAWILAATREADEQLERQLFKHGNGFGIAVLIVDWKSHDEPALAALLASNPTLVSKLLDPVAGALAARLARAGCQRRLPDACGREIALSRCSREDL